MGMWQKGIAFAQRRVRFRAVEGRRRGSASDRAGALLRNADPADALRAARYSRLLGYISAAPPALNSSSAQRPCSVNSRTAPETGPENNVTFKK